MKRPIPKPKTKTGEIARLRAAIDRIDRVLLALLAARARLVRRIGRAKKTQGLNITDPVRKRAVLKFWTSQARQQGLSLAFVKKVYALIHAESVKAQRK